MARRPREPELIPSAAMLDNREAWLSEWNAKVGQ